MNIYLVVEGPIGDKQVYSCWVPLVNNSLKVKLNIDDVTEDSLYIIAGYGYPNYFEVIESAVEDVSNSEVFDRLVIAVDSEDMSYDEKRGEIEEFIGGLGVAVDYRIVIQHFCLETWALGNKAIVTRGTTNERIRFFRGIFDVLTDNPELLPALRTENEQLTRAQFAEKYLRALLHDKYRNLTYNKSNPKALLHPTYFERVKDRFDTTNHIRSFNDFLTAFL